MATFLRNLQKDDFKARTRVNYMAAMLWHLTYVKYLTHPDLNTMSWAATDQLLRQIFVPTI